MMKHLCVARWIDFSFVCLVYVCLVGIRSLGQIFVQHLVICNLIHLHRCSSPHFFARTFLQLPSVHLQMDVCHVAVHLWINVCPINNVTGITGVLSMCKMFVYLCCLSQKYVCATHHVLDGNCGC